MATAHPFKSGQELAAFKKIFATINDRLPTTVWLFETGDVVVLAQPDDKHAEDSLPPNNLRHFEVDHQEKQLKMVSVIASKCYPRLLQYILLMAHYRVVIHRFQNGSYAPALQGSPCDLSELKEVMFVADEEGVGPGGDGGYSEKMLSIGPICSIVIEGDVKSPQVGICFWYEGSKSVKAAEFFDNTAHDKLESILVQFNPMEAIISEQPKYRTVRQILGRNKILAPQGMSKKMAKVQAESDVAKLFQGSHVDEKAVASKATVHLIMVRNFLSLIARHLLCFEMKFIKN